jgi:hypothetical protein
MQHLQLRMLSTDRRAQPPSQNVSAQRCLCRLSPQSSHPARKHLRCQQHETARATPFLSTTSHLFERPPDCGFAASESLLRSGLIKTPPHRLVAVQAVPDFDQSGLWAYFMLSGCRRRMVFRNAATLRSRCAQPTPTVASARLFCSADAKQYHDPETCHTQLVSHAWFTSLVIRRHTSVVSIHNPTEPCS